MSRRIFRMMMLIGTLALTTWLLANTPAVKSWRTKETAPIQTAMTGVPDAGQLALLEEMTTWLKPFDSSNVNCYYDALLTAIDKTDSVHAMINVPYRYARKGASYYFSVGQTENLNIPECYLLADHKAKKILLSRTRNVLHAGMTDLPQLFNFIKGEGYVMKKQHQNGLVTISMLSPNNINVKEFSVAYDSVSATVKRIFVRQSDIADHLNSDLDKLVTLNFNQISNTIVPDSCFKRQKFVTGGQDQWQCAPAISDYELIVR